jgi:hypothetical protein
MLAVAAVFYHKNIDVYHNCSVLLKAPASAGNITSFNWDHSYGYMTTTGISAGHGTTLWRISKSNTLERITSYPSGSRLDALGNNPGNLMVNNEGTAAYVLSNQSVLEISLKD